MEGGGELSWQTSKSFDSAMFSRHPHYLVTAQCVSLYFNMFADAKIWFLYLLWHFFFHFFGNILFFPKKKRLFECYSRCLTL